MTRVTVSGNAQTNARGTLRPIGTFAGDFNPNAGLPTDGTGRDNAILKGDYWRASASGTIAGLDPFEDFDEGDFIYSKINGASVVSQFMGNKASGGGGSGGTVDSVVAGNGIDVDNTDPANPVVNIDDAHFGSAAFEESSSFQPADTDLTAIAGLTPTNDDFIQRKSGAWTNRTLSQVKSDLKSSPFLSDTTVYSVTGVTAETILINAGTPIPIAVGTVLAGDIVRIRVNNIKSGTAGSGTHRLKLNTTPDLSGSPVSIGLWNNGASSSAHSIKAFREIVVISLTSSYISISGTGNAVTDDVATGLQVPISINWGVTQYLILSSQLSNGSDTGSLRSFYLEILRKP